MLGIDVRTARVVWTILVIAGGIALAYALRTPILLFVFALFFAYLIFPLVAFFERRLPVRAARPLAIGIVYVILLLAIVGVGMSVGPRLTDEVTLLAHKAPDMAQQVASGRIVGNILLRRGWDAARVQEAENALRAHAGQIIGYVQGAVTTTLQWLAGAWVVVLVPVFAFFIVKDAEQARVAVEGLIDDPRRRDFWREIMADLNTLLARYVRALIVLSFLTFVAWSIVLFLAGVPYPVGLAAIAGVLELLPVIGPVVAGATAFVVALFSGYPHPWIVLVFFLVWRGIQDYVTSPYVMGRGIEIHPALVMFGVISGGEVAGPAGAFLSVPIIAALRVILRHLRRASIEHVTKTQSHR
jgi:predicted PurR-regulated permease PerM